MDSLHFEGTDMMLCMEEIDLAMLEELVALGGPGQQDQNVSNFTYRYGIIAVDRELTEDEQARFDLLPE